MSGDKTPVMILNEMMAKLGKTPFYELCENKLEATIPQIFIYKVTCDDIEATGTGRSKKDAKHNAASEMLRKLHKAIVVPLSLSAKNKSSVEIMICDDVEATGTGRSKKDAKYNAASAMLEKLQKATVVPPSLPAENKSPVEMMICDDVEATGTARSKKDAEHNTASAMLEKLQKATVVPLSLPAENKSPVEMMICGDVEATGTGRSKTVAKHNAASAMLEKLRKATVVPLSLPAKSKSPVQIMKLLRACNSGAPPSNNDLGNTVQELIILCSKYKLEEPIYKELEVSGPPHARTYMIQCSLSRFSVTGIGNSKKRARKNAAKLMMDRLEGIFCPGTYINGIGNKRQKLLSSKEASLE